MKRDPNTNPAIRPLEPSEYRLSSDGKLEIRPPRGAAGVLVGFDSIWHADGTLTVNGKIVLPGIWSGYLEHGVWREA